MRRFSPLIILTQAHSDRWYTSRWLLHAYLLKVGSAAAATDAMKRPAATIARTLAGSHARADAFTDWLVCRIQLQILCGPGKCRGRSLWAYRRHRTPRCNWRRAPFPRQTKPRCEP